jgi:hypothetical protein
MTKYVFDIDGVICEGKFETRGDAIIGGHGRLGGDSESHVRVGEMTGAGVAWLGCWRYDRAAVWSPE